MRTYRAPQRLALNLSVYLFRRTWKRQYIFVAATMPSGEGKSVAGDLGRIMPGLQWLTGASLHEVQQHVSKAWVPVTQDTQGTALKVWTLPLAGVPLACTRAL